MTHLKDEFKGLKYYHKKIQEINNQNDEIYRQIDEVRTFEEIGQDLQEIGRLRIYLNSCSVVAKFKEIRLWKESNLTA